MLSSSGFQLSDKKNGGSVSAGLPNQNCLLVIRQNDNHSPGLWGGEGVAGDGTLRRFLGVLVIFKNYSIRLDLKNYIDTMIYFLLMFCSLSFDFFFSLYSMISFLLFIYVFKRRVENAFETNYIVVYK